MYIDTSSVPDYVLRYLGENKSHFAVKTSRRGFLGPLIMMGLGLGWLYLLWNAFWKLISPLTRGENLSYIVNGEAIVVSPDNLSPLTLQFIFYLIFFVTGILIVIFGFIWLFGKGPWALATDKELILISKRRLTVWDWEVFNGNIDIEGSKKRGTLTLWMKTSEYLDKTGSPKYSSDHVTLLGIPHADEIKKICLELMESSSAPVRG